MGKLSLLPAEVSDLTEILTGQRLAFSNPVEPFFFALFPETERVENFEAQVKRTEAWWTGDPSAKYMKVVDDETGQIISAAKWCIYETSLTEEQMIEELIVDWHFDNESNFLDMLSTHPDHQKRGAAKILVQWGCEIADRMGVEAFIEGTAVARRLYESCGFVATPSEWTIVNVPEKWNHKPQIKYFFLERQPRTRAVEADEAVFQIEVRETAVDEVAQ
ncbi:uncharacterized protein RSE6_03033 [Rhynchosporium secalis]|uniref:N-acetyltransferase domain-containing protein n=1 Tax=Rhynchosporium secalis TaxID=38038 RepID=A0A1E1M1S5_RHYSE|nr:uncharacterized protein RSE6_03033 [Rhynchosporium secalis]